MDELVLKAKKGNSEAFLKLIEGRINILYKIAFNYFRNMDEASDAVQDSILIVHKSIRKLKDNSKFNSWITSILVNRCREILRRSCRIRFEEYSDEIFKHSYYQSDEYAQIDASVDILDLLQKLDIKYREVITLKYFGDFKINEIAEILKIPQGTVKSMLNSGINKLKYFMEVCKDGM